jgi:hypothetical protein
MAGSDVGDQMSKVALTSIDLSAVARAVVKHPEAGLITSLRFDNPPCKA